MIKAIKFLVRSFFSLFIFMMSLIIAIITLVCVLLPLVILDWIDKLQEWANDVRKT